MKQEICRPEWNEGSPALRAGILHSLRSFKNDIIYSDLGTPGVICKHKGKVQSIGLGYGLLSATEISITHIKMNCMIREFRCEMLS